MSFDSNNATVFIEILAPERGPPKWFGLILSESWGLTTGKVLPESSEHDFQNRGRDLLPVDGPDRTYEWYTHKVCVLSHNRVFHLSNGVKLEE
jgi:hypothetical protein